MANLMKTGVLLAALTVLLVLIGGALGGQNGMVMAFVLALVMNFGSYWFSDKIVLAMYRAQPVDEAAAPALYRIVRTLATRAGIPMPKVYIIPGEAPNAFATGRNPQHAAIAVTEGILRIMSEEELEGVLAHELSHVQNRDTLIMAIAATLAGAITYMAHMAQWAMIFGGGRRDSDEEGSGGGGLVGGLLMIVLAPLAATLIQLAVSRSREFQADATGAQMAGQPWGLAKALEKLEVASKVAPMNATPATAHLFIVNPLTGGGWTTLFSTHPPIAERVARLRALARSQAR
ncbi:MAG TPA: zinc metalloprotease HtpX [Candidatus Dormibacteraeota bacterium]|jgi:heat shock protein HtpX|nr:zinc metalloprotease HtpX [Candidatus Dormibacteraeota bacterium]